MTGVRKSARIRGGVALLLLVHAALAWAARLPVIKLGGDSASYVLLARALRGLSYREIWRVDAPLHGQYPPGYPAVLALWGLPFGDHPEALVLVGIVASVAALALVYDAVRRLWSPEVGLAAVAAVAAAPGLVKSAGTVLSDPLFGFFIALTVWAMARRSSTGGSGEGGGRGGRRADAVAAAAAIAGGLTRVVGGTLAAAVTLVWAARRRFRAAALLGTAALVLLGGWILVPIASPPDVFGRSYAGDFPVAVPRDWFSASSGPASPPVEGVEGAEGPSEGGGGRATAGYLSRPADRGRPLPRRAVRNVRHYVAAAPSMLGIVHPAAGWDAVAVLLALWVGAGAAALLFRWPAAATFLGVYGAFLAVWSWAATRFLEPLLPLLGAGMVVVVAATFSRWTRGDGRAPALLCGFLLLASGSIGVPDLVAERRACRTLAPGRVDPACENPADARFLELMAWVEENTPEDAAFLTGKEAPFHYHTGRATLPIQEAVARPARALPALLRDRGVGWAIVNGGRAGSADEYLARLRANCDRFRVRARVPPDALALELLEEPAAPAAPPDTTLRGRTAADPAGTDACAALSPTGE